MRQELPWDRQLKLGCTVTSTLSAARECPLNSVIACIVCTVHMHTYVYTHIHPYVYVTWIDRAYIVCTVYMHTYDYTHIHTYIYVTWNDRDYREHNRRN